MNPCHTIVVNFNVSVLYLSGFTRLINSFLYVRESTHVIHNIQLFNKYIVIKSIKNHLRSRIIWTGIFILSISNVILSTKCSIFSWVALFKSILIIVKQFIIKRKNWYNCLNIVYSKCLYFLGKRDITL